MGFVTGPTPLDVPGLMVGVCPDVGAVCRAFAIIVLRDDVKEVNFWRECGDS